jgi:ABC-type bacteriocin/lantibiotic exporter with double-glycine peptidase domain
MYLLLVKLFKRAVFYMRLSDFRLVKQKRENACGYATAGMIISYLDGKNISEDFLFENEPFGAEGITFSKLLEVYKKYLAGYQAELVYGSEEKMRSIIGASLQDNIPFHILYLTENLMGGRELVLHHSALIGFDDNEKCFSIADPYGSVKLLGEKDFFYAVSFRDECLSETAKKAPSNLMIRFIPNGLILN